MIIEFRSFFLASVSIASLSFSAPGAAQATPDAVSTPSEAELDAGAIVVTARRTSERLEKVPVAVTAFSPTELTELRIVNENDLQSTIPGLTVRSTNSSEQLAFAIRGQAVDAFSYGAPAVLAYYNETQVSGVAASSFYDLQSIQVIKGPQGTLFGRNATGGAALYQTQAPTDRFEGYLRAGYGNFDNKEAEGAINLPLGEKAALRVAGRFQQRDGFQHNLYNGDTLGSLNSKSIRATLKLDPTDSIENSTTVQRGTGKGFGTSLKMQNIYHVGDTAPDGTPLNVTADAVYNSPIDISDGLGGTMPNPFYTPEAYAKLKSLGATLGIRDFADRINPGLAHNEVISDVSPRYHSKATTITNTTKLDIFGDAKIKNIIGYNKVSSVNLADDDGAPYQILNIGSFGGGQNQGLAFMNRDFSDELQISGMALGNRLTYIAGLYYSNQIQDTSMPLSLFTDTISATPATACPPGYSLGGDGFCGYHFRVKDISKAVFAQIGYKFTETLTLSLGGRWTHEVITIRHFADDGYAIQGVPNGRIAASKPSWTVGLDWQATDHLLLYVAQRGSWRTGGFNGTSANFSDPLNPVTNEFKPETTWDVEVGAKFAGHLGAMPARLNIAVYQQTVRNLIRSVYIGISTVTGNAKEARIRGIEVDASLNLTDWLQVGGNLAYTNAKYTKPAAQVGQASLDFGPYADTAKVAGSAFVRASGDLPGDAGQLVFRGDVYGQTDVYYSSLTGNIVPGAHLPGYFLTNARVEFNNIMGSEVSLAGYVKNLANEKYFTGGIAVGALIGVNSYLPSIGRTYGMELGVKF